MRSGTKRIVVDRHWANRGRDYSTRRRIASLRLLG